MGDRQGDDRRRGIPGLTPDTLAGPVRPGFSIFGVGGFTEQA